MAVSILVGIGIAAGVGVCSAAPDEEALPDFESEAVVVTATKYPQETRDIPASVSVITREEIERSNATNLVDLLVREPGVFVVRQGGMGFAGNVRIRGLGGSPPTQVTVLIDGHPDFMGVMGHILPSAYLLDNVQRIEIVRGPASTLYGSTAMGGVINIITRSADAEEVSRLSATAGTFSTSGSTLRMGGRRGERNWLGTAGSSRTHGNHPYGLYSEKNFSVRVGGPVGSGVKATFSAQAVVYDTLDQRTVATVINGGGPPPPIDSLRQHFDRRDYDLTFDFDGGGAKTSLKLFRNDGDHSFADGWHSDDYVEGIGFTHRRTGARSGVLWGVDVHRYGGDVLNPPPLSGTFDRDERALYVTGDRLFSDGGRAQAGLRCEKPDGFDSKLLPQIGYTRPVGEDTALRASVRRGYRVPSFRELFVLPPRNPDLKPEDIWQYEVGASRTLGKGVLDLALFAMRGSNLIIIDAGQWKNARDVRYRGAEIGYRRSLSGRLSVYANYSYLHPGDAKDGTVGHKAAAGVDYVLGKWRWSADGLLVDRLYGTDPSGQVVRMGGYFLTNIKVGYQINEVYEATLGVENLFDKQYRIDPVYPFYMPGRAFVFGLNSRF
ncbi:hypothetical protein AMK68_01120 [candidate division KD3-62 bacterium DG_56]|uniref:TonB-dependent receptor n=1 Tax=candidate division KD3-62 bacterium DG_56 TaxID=1704032 RepID=A0A0S7XRW6_9BACT|nr:MAG: hypothetical protein AMK68_01120 [candidate division KD3-62 bacterium DG_56]